MKHFDSCRCEQCRPHHPAAAANNCGFLMQQILATGKQQYRCESFQLTLGPLPRNLMAPLQITDVSVCGAVRVMEEDCGCMGAMRQTQAIIPLAVTVCDKNGQRHVTQSEISVCVPLRACMQEGAQYLANAMVRLAQNSGCFAPGETVCVFLDVCVQVFLVLYRPMYAPVPCAPACPDLPLYPQPCKCHRN